MPLPLASMKVILNQRAKAAKPVATAKFSPTAAAGKVAIKNGANKKTKAASSSKVVRAPKRKS